MKVDGSQCKFKISNETLKMCRRCAEKEMKQEQLKQLFAEQEGEKELEGAAGAVDDQSPALASPKKSKEAEKKKAKAVKSPSGGLNSMLKSLAKPAPTPTPAKRAPEAPKKSPTEPLPAAVARVPGGSWTAPMIAPVVALEKPAGEAVTNEAQLVAAVKGFVGQHSDGRSSPREIARFLGTLQGAGGGTAIEVMRSRYHKLRNLLEAHPGTFALHDSAGSEADVSEYEVSLATAAASRNAPSTDLLSLMLPPVTGPLFESVESVLESLGLVRYNHIFVEHEFVPHDLFLCTDGESPRGGTRFSLCSVARLFAWMCVYVRACVAIIKLRVVARCPLQTT